MKANDQIISSQLIQSKFKPRLFYLSNTITKLVTYIKVAIVTTHQLHNISFRNKHGRDFMKKKMRIISNNEHYAINKVSITILLQKL